MATKSRSDYNNSFVRNNYDRISLQIPKGCKEKLQFEATLKGFKSLNAFIVDAIEKQSNLDLSKKTDREYTRSVFISNLSIQNRKQNFCLNNLAWEVLCRGAFLQLKDIL